MGRFLHLPKSFSEKEAEPGFAPRSTGSKPRLSATLGSAPIRRDLLLFLPLRASQRSLGISSGPSLQVQAYILAEGEGQGLYILRSINPQASV